MKQMVHLHMHDHYSLLDGVGTPQEYVLKAISLGHKALAETNHGTCGGFFNFYKECVSNGIKPILGCEAYVCDNMLERPEKKKKGGPAIVRAKLHHINLLAKNANGVRNIQKIITEANVKGFYYKPRIDFECLKRYRDDIIVLTACASGILAMPACDNTLGTKTEREAILQARIKFLKDNFDGNVFLEVMPNEMKIQKAVNLAMQEISHKHKIPIVATNDCHYIEHDDYIVHDTLLMVQSKTSVKDKNRWQFEAKKLYMMSYDEMLIEFKANHNGVVNQREAEEYLDNTNKVADMVDIKMNYDNYVLPKFDIPKEYKDSYGYMTSLADKRWNELKISDKINHAEYRDRLKHELDIINQKGLVNYFLIVRDFIKWAQDKDIAVGVGRGSAAGSLVAYLLGITGVDPIRFGLLFERFINPTRCLHPLTKVATRSGCKRIMDINVGDKVLTGLGNYKEVIYKALTPANSPKCIIETSHGDFNCTQNHRWLVMRDKKFIEVMASQILITDKLVRYDEFYKSIKDSGIKNIEGLNYYKTKHLVVNYDHLVDIMSIEASSDSLNYIDIEVEDDHTFYVCTKGRNYVLTHNSNMPDIDSDFEHDRREDVKNYIIEKYGRDNVASIGTYSTMLPNMCFRDVCRAYEVPYMTINALAKTFAFKTDDGEQITSIQQVIDNNPKMENFAKRHKEIVDIIKRLEGQYRHCSVAAGGVLITDRPIPEYMSLRNSKGNIITEWDKYDIDEAKLLKIDVLGIKTLSVMKNTLKMIGKDLNWLYNVPLDDADTLQAFKDGDTEAVFQFESEGMRKILKRFCDVVFEDLVAVNSLYRPGSTDFIENYVARKNGMEMPSYPFKGSEKFLKETYGICVYQETLMNVVSEFGGLTLGEADILRKAKEKPTDDNKKKIDDIKEKIKKINGKDPIVEPLLRFIDSVGGYSFNKSHAVCYALIGYFTMYLKVHHTKEFCVCVLNNAIGKIDEIRMYTRMAEKRGVVIKQVDVNKSVETYTISKDGGILRGFLSIKGVGDKAVAEIMAKRPFKDLCDFNKKVEKKTCNKTVAKILVTTGAFDDLEPYSWIRPALEKLYAMTPGDLLPRYFYELKHLGEFVNHNPLTYFKNLYKDGTISKLNTYEKISKGEEYGTIGVLMEVDDDTNIIKLDDGRTIEKVLIEKELYNKFKDKLQLSSIVMLVVEKTRYSKGKSRDPILKTYSIVKIFVDKKKICEYILDRGGELPETEAKVEAPKEENIKRITLNLKGGSK